MKKIFLILALAGVTISQSYSQTGKNCFNTQFHKDATNLDPVNAYLMCYLATMIYPDYGLRFWYNGVSGFGAGGDSVKFLEAHDVQFVGDYAKKLGFLF